MLRTGRLILAVLVFAASAASVRADWGAFYQGSPSEAPRRPVAALTDRTGMHPQARTWSRPRFLQQGSGQTAVIADQPFLTPDDDTLHCIAEILRAQDRYGIPDNILLGIGLQEAGVSRGGRLTVWPWAVNAAGEGRIFDNRAAAMAWVRDRQAHGVQSIDVGCLQINLHWHPQAFASLDQGFDPASNVDYAARFLLSLHDETGSWMRAAGAYHSRTPDKAEIYLTALRRNVAVANDRIAVFRGMVGAGTDGVITPVFAQSDLPVPAPDPDHLTQPEPLAPWEHGHWSTRSDSAGGTYGIYSRAALEPVLPQFLDDF
jgi:hypothetical protein